MSFKRSSNKQYATIVVAAANSSVKAREAADYLCDGVGDETEIYAALERLRTYYGGGKLQLTEGTFNIAADIQLKGSKIEVEGMGDATLLTTATAGVNIFQIWSTAGNNKLRNLRATGVRGTGIWGVWCKGPLVTFEGLTLESFDECIDLDPNFNPDQASVRACTFKNSGYGVRAQAGVSYGAHKITECRFLHDDASAAMIGVYIANTARAILSHNHASLAAGDYAYRVFNADQLQISTNYAENADYGLYLHLCGFSSISDNILQTCKYGIYHNSGGGDLCRYIGNEIHKSQRDGFYAGGGEGCVAIGNTVYDSSQEVDATYSNFTFTSGPDGWHLVGNFSMDSGGAKQPAYDVDFNCDLYMDDNKFWGGKTGELLKGAGVAVGWSFIRNNGGYNPVGISNLVVGASPFTVGPYTEPTDVFIRAGTLTAITKGGITLATAALAAGSYCIPLEPGQTCIVTYTVAPTINVSRK